MSDLLRLAAMVVTFVTVVLTAALSQPNVQRDLDLENWNVAAFLNRSSLCVPQEADTQDLYDKDSRILLRIKAKEQIILKLLDGQLPVSEAVAQFQQLNATGGTTPVLGDRHPDETDEDLAYRQVMYWTRQYLAGRSNASATEFMNHLELDWHNHHALAPGANHFPATE